MTYIEEKFFNIIAKRGTVLYINRELTIWQIYMDKKEIPLPRKYESSFQDMTRYVSILQRFYYETN